MASQSALALAVFVLTYVGFFALPHWRGYVAMAGCLLAVAVGVVSPGHAWAAIPWPVLLIFIGVLVLAEALVASNLPKVAAERIVAVSPTAGMAMLLLCLASSFVSIFIENVACVLIMAPLGIAIARHLNTSAATVVIGIAISSNLQGTGTLIGDPPSMLLANALQLGFNDFFIYHGRPSIFFGVQAGALASAAFLYLMFRRIDSEVIGTAIERVDSWIPGLLLLILVIGLAAISFVSPGLDMKSGLFCTVIGLLAGLWYFVRHRHDFHPMVIRLDYQTFFFLLGSFIVVKGVEEAGWLDRFAAFILANAGTGEGGLLILLIVVSVIVSAFVANEPYLIAMLPVTASLGAAMGTTPAENPLLHFGLLLGASLGGNITPIGSSACIVAYGMLQKDPRDRVGYRDFLRIGFPFTVAAVAGGAIFLWFVWHR